MGDLLNEILKDGVAGKLLKSSRFSLSALGLVLAAGVATPVPAVPVLIFMGAVICTYVGSETYLKPKDKK